MSEVIDYYIDKLVNDVYVTINSLDIFDIKPEIINEAWRYVNTLNIDSDMRDLIETIEYSTYEQIDESHCEKIRYIVRMRLLFCELMRLLHE